MKTKTYLILVIACVVGLLCIPGDLNASESEIIYGHVSFAEAAPKVIRADKTEHTAVVNLPVAPGDLIITGAKDRCELQFDNGTVMRMDRNSRLKIVTVLAKSLTSKWKMTTVELEKGKLYTLNRAYSLERFQVITPNVAVKMKRGSVSTISIRSNGDTHIFSDRGKFKVLYGNNAKSLHTETVRNGKGYLITADHKCVPNMERETDFLAWNQYIDRNFKKLHYGKNKIPKKIYRYSKGIVHWAEKWSTLMGEWVYDELFGYVWKPGDESFAYSMRPFFHADFVRVNDELMLIPSQPWGWAPAQLGTWVWITDWGWTWIPGDAFNSCQAFALFPNSAQYASPYYGNTVSYWMNSLYGGRDMYMVYHRYGYRAWQTAFQRRYNRRAVKPSLKNVPDNIRNVLKRIKKAPSHVVEKRMAKMTPAMKKHFHKRPTKKLTALMSKLPSHKRGTFNEANKRLNIKNKRGVVGKKAALNKKTAAKKEAKGKLSNRIKRDARYFRDWNPDKRWAKRRGASIVYSSKTNEIRCPKFKMSSRDFSRSKRTGGFGHHHRSSRSGSYSSSGNGSSSSSRGASSSYSSGSSSRAGTARSVSSSRGSDSKKGK